VHSLFHELFVLFFAELLNSDLHLAVPAVVLDELLTEADGMYRLVEFLYQVDRVELASGRTYSASEALVLVDYGSSASEAARRLSLELFLGEGQAFILFAALL